MQVSRENIVQGQNTGALGSGQAVVSRLRYRRPQVGWREVDVGACPTPSWAWISEGAGVLGIWPEKLGYPLAF